MSVFVVAEVGVNHDGSVERARAIVDIAARAGADAVKFQTFRARDLVGHRAEKAPYQEERDLARSQLEMLEALELDLAAHDVLAEHAARRGIEFMSTPFDESSLELLTRRVGVRRLKLGSGDLTHGPLLLRAARSGLPLLLSTGMAELADVEAALDLIAFGLLEPDATPTRVSCAAARASAEGARALRARLTLLHCTSAYPTPPADVNLRCLTELHARFGVEVGLSDHSAGIGIALAAVALGARVIEKHVTYDPRASGPDHAASLAPKELTALVRGVREVETALGNGVKAIAPSERVNARAARRALVAARALPAGHRLGPGDVVAKRPADGVSPMRYWDILGRTTRRAYAPDDAIELE